MRGTHGGMRWDHNRVAWGRIALACLLVTCLVVAAVAALPGCASRSGGQATPPAYTPGTSPGAPGGSAAPGGSSGTAAPGNQPGQGGSDQTSPPSMLDVLRRINKPFTQLPANSATQPSPFRAGGTMEDFSLPDLDGRAVGLGGVLAANRRGAVVSFVKPDSPACQKDLITLAGSYGELKSQGLEVLVVVACATPEEARAYAQSLALHMPVLVDAGGELGRRLGVTSLPLHVIVRPDHLVWKKALGWAVTEEGTVGLQTDWLNYLKGPGG